MWEAGSVNVWVWMWMWMCEIVLTLFSMNKCRERTLIASLLVQSHFLFWKLDIFKVIYKDLILILAKWKRGSCFHHTSETKWKCTRRHPWYSGIALKCWPTGRQQYSLNSAKTMPKTPFIHLEMYLSQMESPEVLILTARKTRWKLPEIL